MDFFDDDSIPEEMKAKRAFLAALLAAEQAKRKQSEEEREKEEPSSSKPEFQIHTVREANALLKKIDEEGLLAAPIKYQVIDQVLAFEKGTFLVDELHSLINTVFDSNDFYSAYRLAKKALDSFPQNLTFLGDAIRSCAKLGRFEEGESFVEAACNTPIRSWSWYTPVNIADFYAEKIKAFPREACDDWVEKGLWALREYKKIDPLADRLWNSEAELLLAAGEFEEARNVLETAIFEMHASPYDEQTVQIPVAQCCITYLGMIEQTCEWEKLGKIAARGYGSLLQKNPATTTGLFLLWEAMALEGEICDAPKYEDGWGNTKKVLQLLRSYEVAYCGDDNDSKEFIKQRYDIACRKAGIVGRNIDDPVTTASEE